MCITQAFTCVARKDAISTLLNMIRGVSRYAAVFVQRHDDECLDLFTTSSLQSLFDALIQMVLDTAVSLNSIHT